MNTVKLLDANAGDCIHIRFLGNDDEYHNIIIDGGVGVTYQRSLKDEIKAIEKNNEVIDLLVVTHSDQDHISSIIRFFQDRSFIHIGLTQLVPG